ncbi:alpha/beta hydrolase [Dyadobacter sp. CY261]|uniref:alpha/beta fold hydrolase n=1 Tax=Dyadobacter sp. CY261 TaxID=2907203 RepID=UPI001F17FA7A|nr:alpha/beta hydrolase [Dyadobacter sp. CY261]MCF0073031.1 alpha/beta hydrolase [Dyadobacter sp. CY261]
MKNIIYISSLFLVLTCCQKAKDEPAEPIKYGSNNGKYLNIQETKIYYEEYGEGTPLLLLHQGLGSIENVGDIIPELSKHFRVIAPDAPGHGRSEQADSLSGALLADYCSAIIDQLKLDSLYVMGWSMGGNTALLLAANRPDKVKKVVSGGSNTKSSGLTQEGRDLLKEYTVEAVKEDEEWLKHYQSMNPQPDQWIRFWEDTQQMWAREIKVPDEKLAGIDIPVLVIRGDRDMIRLEHSMDIFRALKKGQLCIYPNTGHDMPESKSEMLCKIAIDFFKGSSGKEARH